MNHALITRAALVALVSCGRNMCITIFIFCHQCSCIVAISPTEYNEVNLKLENNVPQGHSPQENTVPSSECPPFHV